MCVLCVVLDACCAMMLCALLHACCAMVLCAARLLCQDALCCAARLVCVRALCCAACLLCPVCCPVPQASGLLDVVDAARAAHPAPCIPLRSQLCQLQPPDQRAGDVDMHDGEPQQQLQPPAQQHCDADMREEGEDQPLPPCCGIMPPTRRRCRQSGEDCYSQPTAAQQQLQLQPPASSVRPEHLTYWLRQPGVTAQLQPQHSEGAAAAAAPPSPG